MQKKRATKKAQTPTAVAPVVGHDVIDAPPPPAEQNKKKKVRKIAAPAAAPAAAEPAAPKKPESFVAAIADPVVAAAAHKKRGRKPKGGKVIQQLVHESASIQDAPNIILHLKCSVSDIPALNTEPSIKPGDVVSFNALETKGADLNESYHCPSSGGGIDSGSNSTSASASANNFIIGNASQSNKPRPTPDALIATNSYNHLNHDGDYDDDYDDDDKPGSNDTNLKDIWKKLNHLKLCFHKSDVFQNIGASTRRSCCFWDTCEFDTPPIYIPRCMAANGGHNVYGCFCSPECALAYLMNEGVDTSVKFERCQMLNAMYGRALNYEKSIKPAPNPQYILNKFYGNLSIQEYRKLFKSEQIIYVVNKPLTHILPEMYEDNNDFLLNNKVIPNNTYKLKKKTSAFG
jgi:hypothetical protein